MSVYDEVDRALSGLNIPYYSDFPRFSREPPEQYIVYSVFDTPQLFADGEEHAYAYTVTVNIITPATDTELRKKVRRAMKAAGFVYQMGLPTGGGEDGYPALVQYSQEYQIILEE